MKKTLAILAALCLLLTLLSGCGRKGDTQSGDSAGTTAATHTPGQTQAQDGQGESNAAQDGGEEAAPGQAAHPVPLEERPQEARYQYSMDDLSLIDTASGQKLTLGMTADQVEAVAGQPVSQERNYRVYDGVVAQYGQDGALVSLIVSGGEFPDPAQGGRYKTSRGVGLSTPFEDFVKAYGDQYSQRQEGEPAGEGEAPAETPATAIRYFRVRDGAVEYLGDRLTDEMRADGEENLYMQDFMFDRTTNQVITMRISASSAVGR